MAANRLVIRRVAQATDKVDLSPTTDNLLLMVGPAKVAGQNTEVV